MNGRPYHLYDDPVPGDDGPGCRRGGLPEEHAHDTATWSADDTVNVTPIDPAEVMPVVFIPWDTPGEDRPSDGHVCDEFCVDDDPPGEHIIVTTVDHGGADDGLGHVFSNAQPGL